MSEHPDDNDPLLVGVISDTHGHLLPKVEQILKPVHAIIHAGDIGSPDILDALGRIAPVYAVRGNMDGGGWTRELPETEVVTLGRSLLYVLHDLNSLDLDPGASGFQAVVTGHTHRPAARRENGVLYLNPGSATFPKFSESASLALLRIRGTALDVDFVGLE